MSRTLLPLLPIGCLTVLLSVHWQAKGMPAAEEPSPAQPLVHRALQAESLGQSGERQRLLKQALELDPDFAPGRWHAGFVKRDGQWLTISDAQEKAAQDDRLQNYWHLANAATLNVKDQLRLARWCDEHGQDDLAKMHWYRVHREKPKNREAAKQLGLKEYKDQFLSPQQIAIAKAYEAASEHWTPRLQAWKRSLRENSGEREVVLGELRQVNDVAAVPFLINEFADDPELAREVVAILGGMSPFETYGWLSIFAVEHEDEGVRASAQNQLVSQLGREPRIRQGLLPTLLSQLQVPAELNYYVSTLGMISYTIDAYGPNANFQTSVLAGRPFQEIFFIVRREPGFVALYLPRPKVLANTANAARAVRRQNQIAAQRNDRLFEILRSVANSNLPDDPQAWWDWWLGENERYLDYDKPTFYRELIPHRPRDVMYMPPLSCFVAGTPVWTETGPKPIEQVKVGERVLSQDSETGELAYRFVTKTTLRPPSKTLRVKIGNDEIWTTLGHLFWVSGKGWRMAKHLENGDLVHSVDGAYPVTAIEKGPTTEAHNLVVDQFNTFFVGERPLLVHDNMPHRVRPTLVPGFVEGELEELAGKK